MTAGASGRRLRAGIVGGGSGAFIGAVHRIAAELDGEAQVVAGALSSNPDNAAASARAWRLQRSYTSYEDMAQSERRLSDGIDFVIIATPNHLHVPVARAFLDAGIHVICDKPLAHSLEQAQELAALVSQRQLIFALTHNYTGYPLVREARDMVMRGVVGEIRKVLVEYNQDWLMEPLETSGNKQAVWRTDPARSGLGGAVGDIGTHALNLLEFVTGLRVSSLCADLSTFVAGRRLDDDANALLRLNNGAKGTLVCSQIACGEENDLRLRIYGTRAGLEWHQQEPNTLIHKPAGESWRLLRTAHGYLGAAARSVTRLPAGHPEGYLEAFATIYRLAAVDIRRRLDGEAPIGGYPSIDDGLRGMHFISAAVRSSTLGAQWVTL